MAALPVSMAELHRERLERLAARGPTVAHEVARGVVVSVRHLPGAAIGSIVWPGARALAGFIGEHPDTVRGRRVLELGAGVGLTALGAMPRAAPVFFADEQHMRLCAAQPLLRLAPQRCSRRTLPMPWT